MVRSCKIALIGIAMMAANCLAVPSQEEVFKSISDNVGQSGDSRLFMIFGCAIVGLIILLVLFNQRTKREVSPKTLNHQGKLLKEIARSIPIRPDEMKQLRLLADETPGPDGEPIASPLSLLLCPSVLGTAIQKNATRANRNVLAGIRKKIIFK